MLEELKSQIGMVKQPKNQQQKVININIPRAGQRGGISQNAGAGASIQELGSCRKGLPVWTQCGDVPTAKDNLRQKEKKKYSGFSIFPIISSPPTASIGRS